MVRDAVRAEVERLEEIDRQLAELEKVGDDIKRHSADLAILQQKYQSYRRRMRIDDLIVLSVMFAVFAAAFLTRIPLAPFICLVAGGIAVAAAIKVHKTRSQQAMESTIGIMETESATLRQRLQDTITARPRR